MLLPCITRGVAIAITVPTDILFISNIKSLLNKNNAICELIKSVNVNIKNLFPFDDVLITLFANTPITTKSLLLLFKIDIFCDNCFIDITFHFLKRKLTISRVIFLVFVSIRIVHPLHAVNLNDSLYSNCFLLALTPPMLLWFVFFSSFTPLLLLLFVLLLQCLLLFTDACASPTPLPFTSMSSSPSSSSSSESNANKSSKSSQSDMFLA